MRKSCRNGILRIATALVAAWFAYAIVTPADDAKTVAGTSSWAATGYNAKDRSAPERLTQAVENEDSQFVAARAESPDGHDGHANIGHGHCGVACNSVVVAATMPDNGSATARVQVPPHKVATDADPFHLYFPPKTS